MSVVKSVAIYSDDPWVGGKIRRRYEVTLTDYAGNDHTKVIGRFVVDPTSDDDLDDFAVSKAIEYLESLEMKEIQMFKSAVEEGINLFGTERWNSRLELIKPILDDALSLPATDPIVFNGMGYLQNVTDDELKALYSENQLWVDSVRDKASSLLIHRAGLNAYVPVRGRPE